MEEYSMVSTCRCGSCKERSKRKTVGLQLSDCDEGIKFVSKKLQVLEEEASKMREVMHESREIMEEVWELFSNMHTAPHSSAHQEGIHHNVGLLQLLCKDSSPEVAAVTRGFTPTKANAFSRRLNLHGSVSYV